MNLNNVLQIAKIIDTMLLMATHINNVNPTSDLLSMFISIKILNHRVVINPTSISIYYNSYGLSEVINKYELIIGGNIYCPLECTPAHTYCTLPNYSQTNYKKGPPTRKPPEKTGRRQADTPHIWCPASRNRGYSSA